MERDPLPPLTTDLAGPLEPLSLTELMALPRIEAPTLSWAGDRVALFSDRSGQFELYVLELSTRRLRQLTHRERKYAASRVVWDRAGRSIFFCQDDQGNEEQDILQLDLVTGEVRMLVRGDGARQDPIQVSPDGRWLSMVSERGDESGIGCGLRRLWKVNISTGERLCLTDFAGPIFGGVWSPDGSWLTCSANEDQQHPRNRDGYLVRADGNWAARVLCVRPGSRDDVVDIHPNGHMLAVRSDARGVPAAGVLDQRGGRVAWLSPPNVEEHAVAFSRRGRFLLCLRSEDACMKSVLYDVSTRERIIPRLEPGYAFATSTNNTDDKLLVSSASDRTRLSLLHYDLANDTSTVLLQPEYGRLDPAQFVESRNVTYRAHDETMVPAILYEPRNYGTRRPAVIWLHGGPTQQWGRGFNPFAQYLVSLGFLLLLPNVRGSTGYGVRFRDAALGDWGGVDLADVLAALDYLRDDVGVDAERVALFGGSYGGYLALLGATMAPRLWKAVVAFSAFTDLRLLYAQGNERSRYHLREQMGDPATRGDLWTARSPVTHAHRLMAKLLLMHGIHDPRCPIEHARAFRTRLLDAGKREGVDFDYVEYDDFGHQSLDGEQRARQYGVIANFLQRILLA